MRKSLLKKRGVSPVIATVLLIAMVVVIALIIFMWFKGLTQEKILKFDQNIELVCPDVSFYAEQGSNGVIIENTGDVPIFSLKVQEESGRSYETKNIDQLDLDWPNTGLNPGEIYESSCSPLGERVVFIPVLAGTSEEGEKSYTCDKKWGVELE